MRRRQALSFLAVSPLLAQAQSAAKKPPPPPAAPMSAASAAAITELGSDIDLMREILATLHPGLLRYNAQIQIDTTMTSIKRSFGSAPDLSQRYLVLSRFLAMLKCGHSYANFFNQKPEVQQALFNKKSRLPFAMRWVGEGMFVTSEQDKLQRGTQVGAINGVPVRTMLAALLPYTRADGNNDAKRRNLLNLRGLNKFEFFDIFHGLVYGEPPGGVFRLDVKTPDGKISAIEVPALTTAERHAQLPQVADDAPRWDWRLTEQGVAVLAMPDWALSNSKWDWQAWLTDKLDSLAGDDAAKGLVVDLRGNEGGLDCGNPILERFLTADSVLPMRRLVRVQKTPPHLNKVLDTSNESFRDWGDKAKRFDDRFFALPAGETTVKPKGTRIDKPLVVLTDAANSAATFSFVQRIKSARVGKLVGEATGGNQRGINGGAFFFARLPASGLEFDLPLIGSFAQQPAPDAGIEPDVKVDLAAIDIATGIDAQMERALATAKGA